ncbi:hypothetical protein O3G_MSEX008986 [Manduca sexta]|uniref:Uncharacterized protein n=1 Tax=Manduca sexta TaxID=7130 RepID=A0A922CQZ2_MANSE|nr:hypothetical protein O3G_MSEX008986 [Manduca sexta]
MPFNPITLKKVQRKALQRKEPHQRKAPLRLKGPHPRRRRKVLLLRLHLRRVLPPHLQPKVLRQHLHLHQRRQRVHLLPHLLHLLQKELHHHLLLLLKVHLRLPQRLRQLKGPLLLPPPPLPLQHQQKVRRQLLHQKQRLHPLQHLPPHQQKRQRPHPPPHLKPQHLQHHHQHPWKHLPKSTDIGYSSQLMTLEKRLMNQV